MLGQEQGISRSNQGLNGPVTSRSGGFLWALARASLCIHEQNRERNLQLIAGLLAMDDPGIRILMEAVMNMHRLD
jgi:hypothetical protein